MKIINNGKEKRYSITCPDCRSDLEYTSQDVKDIDVTWRDSEGGKHTGVKNVIVCPVCKSVLIATYKNVYTEVNWSSKPLTDTPI